MAAKDKAPIIDERTDSRVNSLSLALTFIVLGLFLSFWPTYLGDEFVTSIIRWVFVTLGVLGIGFSFGEKDSPLRGASDIGAGVVFLGAAVLAFGLPIGLIAPILALLFALIGAYGTIRGLLFLVISTSRAVKELKAAGGKTNSFLLVIEFLTKLVTLAVVIAQLAKLLA
ncbi:MAG: hypothetical protein V8R08_06820 [Coriobacteriales bacterium]